MQSGHNIEKLREKIRELMKQIVSIYSASKLLPYVLEGLRSKNNRTRIECVDLVGYLIDHYGAEVHHWTTLYFTSAFVSFITYIVCSSTCRLVDS